jgi:hypothetical protein
MGIEKGEEVKAKGIDGIFIKVVSETFSSLEKERVTSVKEAFRTLKKAR